MAPRPRNLGASAAVAGITATALLAIVILASDHPLPPRRAPSSQDTISVRTTPAPDADEAEFLYVEDIVERAVAQGRAGRAEADEAMATDWRHAIETLHLATGQATHDPGVEGDQ